MTGRLRLATRRSTLALAQARSVAALLTEQGVDSELVEITTSGDRGDPDRVSDKSRWVLEIEEALLANQADVAVHSAKDVPGELAPGLEIKAVPPRADARDALCGAESLYDLAAGARVATSSLRRRAQLLATRDDLEVVSLRGNVDTRLRRLGEGDFDAMVLARAGLERLDRAGEGTPLDPARFVPAPGQGALALEARAGDEETAAVLAALDDASSHDALNAERALVAELDASCHTPVGAHAVPSPAGLTLTAFAGLPDGSRWVGDRLEGDPGDPAALGREVAARLRAVGVDELLREAERTAAA